MSDITLSPDQTERLRSESIAWLTTVNAKGAPAPTPVWFLWTGDELLLYSKPGTGKLAAIARNPAVSLNLNGDDHGGHVLVINGTAREDAGGTSEPEWAAYVEKYRGGMGNLGTTPEGFRDEYSVLVRITPERLRGW